MSIKIRLLLVRQLMDYRLYSTTFITTVVYYSLYIYIYIYIYINVKLRHADICS